MKKHENVTQNDYLPNFKIDYYNSANPQENEKYVCQDPPSDLSTPRIKQPKPQSVVKYLEDEDMENRSEDIDTSHGSIVIEQI